MKTLMLLLLSLSVFTDFLEAKIIQTDTIQEINKEITLDTLVLFNIAEVLMDTKTSLGTQAWRKYIKARVDSKTHDALTLFVFKNVPPKAPEALTPLLINELQKMNVPVLAFTSRGRHEWYSSSQIASVDILTEELLRQVNIDFSKTKLPSPLSEIGTLFADYYHEGVIYTTNSVDKGMLLKEILEKTGYKPAKILFVDDKIDSLKSVETAIEKNKIEFVGFAYSRTAKDHENFDPMIANIQLNELISSNKLLTDKEAMDIKTREYANVNPEEFFAEILKKWKTQ